MADATPCILGVDPGASGAIAFYFPSRPDLVSVYDVPLVDGEIDPGALVRKIQQFGPTVAFVERVGAMPGQGVSSTFKFGVAYGVARAVIATLCIPSHLVVPGRWKKHFGLDADKEKARALAVRLWPSSEHFERKKDHGRAEAALIARYGAEVLPPASLG